MCVSSLKVSDSSAPFTSTARVGFAAAGKPDTWSAPFLLRTTPRLDLAGWTLRSEVNHDGDRAFGRHTWPDHERYEYRNVLASHPPSGHSALVANRSKYAEGDWFAVPLRDGGYALGIVARASRGGVLLGYFFGPRRVAAPTLLEVAHLRADAAILIGRFGHLGLKQGKWTTFGRLDGWDRTAWPMPRFVRYEELTGRSFAVVYDPDDPNRLLREDEISPGTAEQCPRDAMAGAGAVEIRLTRLLAP
jgi:hypothetical protein